MTDDFLVKMAGLSATVSRLQKVMETLPAENESLRRGIAALTARVAREEARSLAAGNMSRAVRVIERETEYVSSLPQR